MKKSQSDSELMSRLLEVLDEAMSVDQAVGGKIRVVNPDAGTLEIRAHRGFSERFLETFAAIGPDAPLASARAYRLRRRVVVPDLAHDPLPDPYRSAAIDEGFRAMQSTPIIGSSGQVIGTLSTHFSRAYALSTAAALVLDYCATRAAAAIERFGGAV